MDLASPKMVPTAVQNSQMRRASRASIATALFLIILKAVTVFFTHSIAMLSSLIDSCQDLMTSTINLVAIHHATTPADDIHRFGHGKAQALGSLIQSIIILLASLFLLYKSINTLRQPASIDHLPMGITITLIALGLTITLVRYQTHVIKATGSLSIKADRAHYTGDILMNIGVLITMTLSYLFNVHFLDAIFGVGVAIYLLTIVYELIKESLAMLMDAELPADARTSLIQTILQSPTTPPLSAIYDIKTRQSGTNTIVQFTLHLPADTPLSLIQQTTDQINAHLHQSHPTIETIILVAPDKTPTSLV